MSRRVWYEVAELDELAEGRVKSAACGRETVCVARHRGGLLLVLGSSFSNHTGITPKKPIDQVS